MGNNISGMKKIIAGIKFEKTDVQTQKPMFHTQQMFQHKYAPKVAQELINKSLAMGPQRRIRTLKRTLHP